MVLPCLPIIFPTSFGATRTSMSVDPLLLDFTNIHVVALVDQRLHDHLNCVSHDCAPKLGFRGGCLLRVRAGLDQSAYCIGRLRAFFDPVVDSGQIEFDFGRISRGIVRTEIFQIRAVAFRLFLFHNDAVRRAFLRAGAH